MFSTRLSREMNGALKVLARNTGIFEPSFGGNNAVLKLRTLQHVRHKYTTPTNTVIMFVPQQEAWVVERMGKFYKVLEPGLNWLIPIIDTVKYVQSLKEIAIEIPKQSAITTDNVTLNIDGILYLRINDPYLASYGVEDPEFAIMQLAQTTMRSELGKMSLDKIFREREDLNVGIVDSINKASKAWGITCLRYEIRDIRLPQRVHEAMQMQVEAERKKRAAILESEGVRAADVNVAEGKRLARILSSEAIKQEQINKASGEAAAIIAVAEARAKGLSLVADAMKNTNAKNATALCVAEQYVDAFRELAKTNNTMILPSNMADVSSFMAQAMAMYKHLTPGGAVQKAAQLESDLKDNIPSIDVEGTDVYNSKAECKESTEGAQERISDSDDDSEAFLGKRKNSRPRKGKENS